MIGQQPRSMDPYALAFAPLNAVQETTNGALQQLGMLQELQQKPRLAQQTSQDNLLRALGDMLPPEVINMILQQRLPEMSQMMPQGMNQPPPGISPEMLQTFQQILNKPQ